jgi:ATP-dependent helicase HrpB
VPSGSRVALDYTAGERPVLAVRVQEVLGSAHTPTVLDGALPVLLHLLSPARRPVQVTDDLDGFWERAYPQVRAELRGRYPKHDWPEDPRRAAPAPSPRRRRRA